MSSDGRPVTRLPSRPSTPPTALLTPGRTRQRRSDLAITYTVWALAILMCIAGWFAFGWLILRWST